MPTRFNVNIDSIVEGADRIGNINFSSLRYEIQAVARETLLTVFQAAVEYADSEGGFPEEFQNHVMSVVNQMPVRVEATAQHLAVVTDFEFLGDRGDLERAFHQGAMLADGSKLWGPYTGQALKNDDADSRHVFWEALQSGSSHADVLDPKTGRVNHVPIRSGAWEETKQQYIRIWGNKAPEWLFIQWGQEEWEPYVPQWDIISDFEDQLNARLAPLIEYFVESEVAIANTYEASGLTVGFTKRGSAQLQSPIASIGGKTYRKGQFVPKNPSIDEDFAEF